MGYRYRISSAPQWTEERSRGKRSFILRVGLLRWGVATFLLLTTYYALTGELAGGLTSAAARLLTTAAGLCIGGWIFGEFMWRYYSKRFG